jgi:hypothetical protein
MGLVGVLGLLLLLSPAVLAGDGDVASQNGDTADPVVTWSAEDDTDAAALPAGANSLEFVSLANGCRVFDTRVHGPAFGGGTTRGFGMLDSDLVAQGGNPAGCGIPEHAAAVDISLSTIGGSPTAAGFLRAGPFPATPTATVLQFLRGQGTSVTTTVGLEDAIMNVRILGGTTHIAGDVVGYWQRKLHATVFDFGNLVTGSGVTSITHNSTGFYVVEFERDVSECTPVATPATVTPDVRARAELNGPVGEVFVIIQDFDSTTPLDKKFQLVMAC